MFGHSHMIDSGTEGHRNTQLCGGLEVHLVHTNAILGQHLEAGQAFLQHRACERVVTAKDSVVVPDEGEDGGLRQGATRPLNVIGIPCKEIMVPARCVLERRRCDQDARLAHGGFQSRGALTAAFHAEGQRPYCTGMPPAAGAADAWLSLLRLQRSIGNSPIRRLLSRGKTSLYTTFEHFLSPCTPRADTQAHVLIGWQLGAHAHDHVDTRPALGAAAWPQGLFA